MERKRMTAKIAGLDEVTTGKFIKKSGFESNYILTKLGRKISRARVMGIIVDKYKSEDGNYATITLDDSSETLRAKVFVNASMFDDIKPGDLIDMIGKVREYNSEIYLIPEIIRKVSPNKETLRMLELKKIFLDQAEKIKKLRDLQKQSSDLSELKVLASKASLIEEDVEGILEAEEVIEIDVIEKTQETSEIKDKIIKLIDTLDAGKGADYQKILSQSELSEGKVDAAIQDLLESGICFEPKAGMIKKL
jgi:uncharacterized protein